VPFNIATLPGIAYVPVVREFAVRPIAVKVFISARLVMLNIISVFNLSSLKFIFISANRYFRSSCPGWWVYK